MSQTGLVAQSISTADHLTPRLSERSPQAQVSFVSKSTFVSFSAHSKRFSAPSHDLSLNDNITAQRAKKREINHKMPYFSDLNTYLHQSSLFIQAYPSARITTKYSLPRKPKAKADSKSKEARIPAIDDSAATDSSATPAQTQQQSIHKRERSAVLTLKTYHPESGICLKYRTDKAAEVGRLLTGLGRLAKGESIDMPTAASAAAAAATVTDGDADKMDIDSGDAISAAVKVEDKTVTAPPAATQGGGGGKGKKKKGKK